MKCENELGPGWLAEYDQLKAYNQDHLERFKRLAQKQHDEGHTEQCAVASFVLETLMLLGDEDPEKREKRIEALVVLFAFSAVGNLDLWQEGT